MRNVILYSSCICLHITNKCELDFLLPFMERGTMLPEDSQLLGRTNSSTKDSDLFGKREKGWQAVIRSSLQCNS
jgi:hypothetical protein